MSGRLIWLFTHLKHKNPSQITIMPDWNGGGEGGEGEVQLSYMI